MKRITFLIILAFYILSCESELEFSDSLTNNPKLQEIKEISSKVFAWQVRHPGPMVGALDWQRSTFYTGVMAAYLAFGGDYFKEQALNWAKQNSWKVNKRPRNADDQACGQVYLELYTLGKKDFMIADVKDSIDNMIASPLPGRVDWWWCDALYMAPPVVAKLGKVTGNNKYFDYLNAMWWDVTDLLYDETEGLFYRDERFVTKRDENGEKIFWSRGNGWVIGGLVRVLQQLPAENPKYEQYVQLLQEMAASIAKQQHEDGLWRTNLLNPEEFPYPETSGSGFFCYALAWGINNGLLSEEEYRPVVEKAWKGLSWAVNDEGRLGWAQVSAASPGEVSEDNYEEYSSGAFLLAASEVYKLYSKEIADKGAL